MPAVYLHIPFCRSKCHYCDFHSLSAMEKHAEDYVSALTAEIRYHGRHIGTTAFDSLYIGGGTPTLLTNRQLDRIVSALRDSFRFSDGAEYTIEANPNSLNLDKAHFLRHLGVNRVSLGVQAFQESLLSVLGRTHHAQDVWSALETLRQANLPSINVDLISGLPGQGFSQWQESLRLATEAGVDHMSCYALSVAPGTEFARALDSGRLSLPNEDLEADMFAETMQFLPRRGWEHYEISNFARPGYRCRHNQTYWRTEPYLGFGAGAHSYWEGIRRSVVSDLKSYICHWVGTPRKPAYDWQEIISQEAAMDEMMFMGLRLLEGVSETVFTGRFGCSFADVYGRSIRDLTAAGLVVMEQGRLRLTEAGVYFGNRVFSAFVR